MIHIFLLILKIIGIILLVIFCLALLILFFPITYTANINLKDEMFYGKLKAGWLFNIIRFGMKFEKKDVSYKLRVLGISVFSSKRKEKKRSKKEKDEKDNIKKYKNKKESTETSKDSINSFTKSEKKQEKNETHIDGSEETNIDLDTELNNSLNKAYDETESETKSKKNIIEKIKEIFCKVKGFIYKIKGKISDVFVNVKKYYNKAKEIKELITANTTKEAYNYGKKKIIKLMKHIFPKKIKGKLLFGFEQPHMTGQVLGYIAMAFSMFHINPKQIVIEPDFEKKIMVGNVKLKGRVLVGVVAYYILKLYFKKEIKEVIKKFN